MVSFVINSRSKPHYSGVSIIIDYVGFISIVSTPLRMINRVYSNTHMYVYTFMCTYGSIAGLGHS